MTDENNLQSDDFVMAFTGLDDVIYKLKTANIPGVNINPDGMGNGDTIEAQTQGDRVSFEELTITFIVDANLQNYMKINDWIHKLAKTDGFLAEDATVNFTTNTGVLTNSRIVYENVFPISLGSIDLDVDGENTVIVATAVFVYDSWKFYDTLDAVLDE
ncbi:MAG: hypothetical protein KAS32_23325 [Candidatus Peribacteraceae bacterium]|nr:hypothetical protein [Candidatus Peribacteraceae bacterium]